MNKDYFETKQLDGIVYPVVKRKKGEKEIKECPYCGKEHTHSLGEGHRIAHCKTKDIEYVKAITIKGVEIPVDRGYIIEEI